MRVSRIAIGGVVSALLLACSSSSTPTPGSGVSPDGGAALTDDQQKTAAALATYDALRVDVLALAKAADDLRAAAPAPVDRGWDVQKDADAIAAMRAAWMRARTSYEHIEGALAPLFPDIDTAIDARYDDFLLTLGASGDPNAFDGQGVTGMHAVERILFVDTTPARVVEFESHLTGYGAGRFPATAEEAASFKNGLCDKLVQDVKTLVDDWTPENINVEIAYSGLVSLVLEQREKVQKASTNEEESRYSQRTMVDLRDNLAGTKNAYGAFDSWLVSKPGGSDLDRRITTAFATLKTAYAAVPEDSIPVPPASWSAESPSADDLATPFGVLYSSVEHQVDDTDPGSLVSLLDQARTLLGLRKFE